MCLASVFRESKEAVLDLACGVGHLTHYLSYGLPDKRVEGIERDFFRLILSTLRGALQEAVTFGHG